MSVRKQAADLIRSLVQELERRRMAFNTEANIKLSKVLEALDGPSVGDGTPDAALFIAEEAFKAGYTAGWQDAKAGKGSFRDGRWDEFEPSEMAKELS